MGRWTYIGLALALIGPGFVAILSQQLATNPETLSPRAFSLALFTFLTIAVIWIARRKEGLSLPQLGFANSTWRSLILAIPLTGFFIYIYGPVIYAFVTALDIGGFEGGLAAFHQLPFWYLLLAITIVAGAEEWLYRGYAIERLEALTGSPWAAGALSLLAFMAVHLPLWGTAVALSTGIAGVIFTVLYLWRRDVMILIIAHIATDLVGIALTHNG